MRRRSERKKSTDVSSPAPASRRTNRRRKSPSVSEEDKITESNELKNEKQMDNDVEESGGERDSSEERSENKRRRSSRMRTPVKELGKSPAKRRTRREVTPDNKINTIVEEENGAANSDTDNADVENQQQTNAENDKQYNQEENVVNASAQKTNKENGENTSENEIKKDVSLAKLEETKVEKVTQPSNDILKKDEEDETRSSEKSEKNDVEDKEDQDEVKLHTRDNSPRSRSNSNERKQPPNKCGNDNGDEEPEEGEVIEKANILEDENNARPEVRERILKRHTEGSTAVSKDDFRDHHKSEEVNNTQDGKTNESSNTTAAADTGRFNANTVTTTTRKRRWITKKATESKEQILAISTDSLKTLIADVHPVPLSDVQLESSSEVEELASEREEGEQSPSPEPERRRDSIEKLDKASKLIIKSLKENNRQVNQAVVPGVGTVPPSIQRSPSPARNQASSVLYITNLVRPFTVLQLKGLLARTGKIVENGFWIDRIKSKCYVEYETEE